MMIHAEPEPTRRRYRPASYPAGVIGTAGDRRHATPPRRALSRAVARAMDFRPDEKRRRFPGGVHPRQRPAISAPVPRAARCPVASVDRSHRSAGTRCSAQPVYPGQHRSGAWDRLSIVTLEAFGGISRTLPFGVVRQSKQDIGTTDAHRCTRMDLSPACSFTGEPLTVGHDEPRHYSGRCPIRVHLCASVVPMSCLLCHAPHSATMISNSDAGTKHRAPIRPPVTSRLERNETPARLARDPSN